MAYLQIGICSDTTSDFRPSPVVQHLCFTMRTFLAVARKNVVKRCFSISLNLICPSLYSDCHYYLFNINSCFMFATWGKLFDLERLQSKLISFPSVNKALQSMAQLLYILCGLRKYSVNNRKYFSLRGLWMLFNLAFWCSLTCVMGLLRHITLFVPSLDD